MKAEENSRRSRMTNSTITLISETAMADI
jgi:hypothetical protein